MIQRVIVKARYTRPRVKNHLAYIQREGVGPDGKKPELFTGDGCNLQTQTIKGKQQVLRLFLSAKHGERIEKELGLQQFTKDFMKELERKTGLDLQWCVAAHYNTHDHPHTHILILGMNADGNEILVDSSMLKTRAREIEQEWATVLIRGKEAQL
jgi:type IV secretory pathway VirD2 relaxase